MKNAMVVFAACAAALAGSGAHAQNKCVDANGKVTYQQDPCPGTARSEPIKSPSAVQSMRAQRASAPARSASNALSGSEAAAPPRPYTGPSSMALRIEASEIESCAGDWDIQADTMRHHREEMDRTRSRGRDTRSDEVIAMTQMQRFVVRFLPKCGKFGFVAPTDPAAEQRDAALAKELWRKHDAKLAEIASASAEETAAHERASAYDSEQRRRAEQARECEKARKQIADARPQLVQLSAEQRAQVESAMLGTECAR